jgi:hypothetical protein
VALRRLDAEPRVPAVSVEAPALELELGQLGVQEVLRQARGGCLVCSGTLVTDRPRSRFVSEALPGAERRMTAIDGRARYLVA